MKNKYSPAIVIGFGAAALSTIPILKGFPMCLIVPLAVYFTLTVHFKLNGLYKIPPGRALFLGFLTGLSSAVFSGIFETLITYFTRTNDLIENFPAVEDMFRGIFTGQDIDKMMIPLRTMRTEIQTTGFSLLYSISMSFGYIFMDVFMGLVGGAIFTSFFHKKFKESNL
jgi:hypothetical protein